MSATPLILGVDPGTQVTGYGIIDPTGVKERLIDFGCIRPPAKLPLSLRYQIIYRGVKELIEKYSPKSVAVETQFVAKNPQSAIKLGMARGVIVLAATECNVAVFEYPPKRAKKALVGLGSASKYQVQSMIQALFLLPSLPEPEDAADAIALALCHAHAEKTKKALGVQI